MKFFTTFFTVFMISGSYVNAQTIDTNYVDGTIYMKVHDTSDVDLDPYDYSIVELNGLMTTHGVTEMIRPFKTPDPSVQKVYRLKFTDWSGIDALIIGLNDLSFVEYAEKAPLYYVDAIPDDLNESEQWNLEKIDAPLAWDITTGSDEIVVAVVDNAVSTEHIDLASNLAINDGETPGNFLDDDLNGYTDDVNGYDVADGDNDPAPPSGTVNSSPFVHGTHCAGIVSAATNNSTGIASLGYSINYLPVKCSPDSGEGDVLTNAYEGLDYAISAGADVVSMSFGSSGSFLTWDVLISSAQSEGIFLVAAAGNADTTEVHYPAGYPYVFSVGATASTDVRSFYSNHGDWIDVMAPGSGIYSTLPEGGNTYGDLSGTSMACPLVASLAGLILSVDETISVSELKTLIKDGCVNIDDINPDYAGQLGSGRINAYNSLNLMPFSSIKDQDKSDTQLLFYPNPSSGDLYLKSNRAAELLELEILDLSGSLMFEDDFTGVVTGETVRIDLNDLEPGHYLVRTKDEQSQEIQKLVIH